MNLEKLKQKVQHEMESLEGVYQIIKDHNDYLKSQLETFVVVFFCFFLIFILKPHTLGL